MGRAEDNPGIAGPSPGQVYTPALHFLGSEWVVAQGHLCIPDEHLLGFGIVPPIRKFYGVDSVRIQFRKDTPHTPDNIIDVGDNCKQANTAAMKYATRIGQTFRESISIEKIRKEVGWQPKVKWDRGIREMYEWFVETKQVKNVYKEP